MSRKMTFVDGKITLYGQDIVIFPPTTLSEYILQSNNDRATAKMLYSNGKAGMIENKESFVQACKTADKGLWICELIDLYGLGKIRYENQSNTPKGKIFLENSTISQNLIGKVKGPTDHILRGIIAGIASSIFGEDLDVVEIECCTDTNKSCILLVESKSVLIGKFPELFSTQI